MSEPFPAGQVDGAEFAQAWRAFEDGQGGLRVKAALCRTLGEHPEALTAEHAPSYLRLLRDIEVGPDQISSAGWRLLAGDATLFGDADADPDAVARRLEEHDLARVLLSEAPVDVYAAERPLTALRRRLLFSGAWRGLPRLTEALRRQAVLNQGAWLIEDDERARLDQAAHSEVRALYFASAAGATQRPDLADQVTRAVAEQYENWPYPQWTRLSVRAPRTLADDIAELDPDGPQGFPPHPQILIAGCGTGRHAASVALRYPAARITAIDISEASLAYARTRCQALGILGVEFLRLDIHRLADLGRRFDAISCAGVLHHLPDPERGWAALVEALNPGGVLHIMVYSKLCRLRVQGLRTALGGLVDGPLDGDRLREIRRRIIERFPERIPLTRDFYTLTGVHDLLAHRHEDPFDVLRIARAIAAFDLEFLGFGVSHAATRRRYLEEFPQDPHFRDFRSWSAFEKNHPYAFAGMYDFWCRRR